jgi:hypothetical protein
MSRDPLQTITLPVLVDADSPENADGEGTCFPSPGRTKFMSVRTIQAYEILRRARKIFPGKKLWLFIGVKGLERAYRRKNERAYQGENERALLEAIEQVRPWTPFLQIQAGTVKEDWTGDKIWEGARWLYSSVMSNALQTARLVMWWAYKGERIVAPAVYCPDWETAAFALMGSIRVCPKCEKMFIPSAGNVVYCTPAHGVAHRTALSRGRKKASQGKA